MTTVTPPVGVQIHPDARCETSSVGAGTRIWAFAHLLPGAVVGRDCKIGDHVFIEDGVVLGDRVTVKNASLLFRGVHIGDDVFVGPGVTFTNDLRPRAHHQVPAEDLLTTHVASGVSLGARVTVVCGVEIGAHALVAAGGVVTRDVPAHALVAGIPARRVGWVCRCGDRLGADLRCGCGRLHRENATRGLVEITAEDRP